MQFDGIHLLLQVPDGFRRVPVGGECRLPRLHFRPHFLHLRRHLVRGATGQKRRRFLQTGQPAVHRRLAQTPNRLGQVPAQAGRLLRHPLHRLTDSGKLVPGAGPQALLTFLFLTLRLHLLGDAALQIPINGRDRVLHGIDNAPPAAHGLFGRTVQISLPAVLPQPAAVIGIGSPIAELPFLEKNHQPRPIAFPGLRMGEFAKPRLRGQVLTKGILHGIHAGVAATSGLLPGFAGGLVHQHHRPVRRVGIQPFLQRGQPVAGQSDVAFDVEMLVCLPETRDLHRAGHGQGRLCPTERSGQAKSTGSEANDDQAGHGIYR